MPFIKRSRPGGKKQTPMPGPNSAAYKKIVAAKKAGAAGKRASGKGGKKPSKSTATFSSLKSRQMVVDRVKREIWASVLAINDAIITLAKAGNFHAAKALFDFAGVYSLPETDEQSANAATANTAASAPAATPAAHDPVDAFFRSIGVEPSCAEPEPSVAMSAL